MIQRLILLLCLYSLPYINSYSQAPNLINISPQDSFEHEIIVSGNFFDNDFSAASLSNFTKMTDLVSGLKKNQQCYFLGNVIPKIEMDEDSPKFIELNESLTPELKKLKGHSKNTYFLPGNNEWFDGTDYTVDGLRQAEKYIENIYEAKNRFQPSKGCGDPELIKINDDLVIILIDSQWLMQGESTSERKKSSCEADNNLEFITHLKEILAKNKSKHIVMLMHHPIYSRGKLGGSYSLKNHLMPLPVLGTIITSIRKLAVDEQSFGHPDYERFRSSIKSTLSNCDNCVLISSHENNLQYHSDNANHFFTIGSGSETDYCRKKNDSEFSLAESGFARISITERKELVIDLYVLNNKNNEIEWVFQKRIAPKIPIQTNVNSPEKSNSSFKQTVDPIRMPASRQYEKQKFLRGKFYRESWSTEVLFDPLFLDEEHGGLTPVQQGGGFQTQSLRLENEKGQQWVLRSIDKDVEKVVPPELRGTFAQNLIQDGIASSHPFGALAIPTLAESAGVYHAHPRLVYLPQQAALGEYNYGFADKLYLYEERPGGNTKHFDHYDNTEKTISTLELLENLEKNHKHQVDQLSVLRARLFDIWIGDWDRHDDQWRWATFEENKITIYRPIPRDRDQVFFKNDGFLDYLASRPYFNPGLRKFDHKIDFLPGLIFNARHFDRSFLNQLRKADFIAAAQELQQAMSDSIIHQAFNSWPQEIQEIDKEDIISKLKSRRRDLENYASEFYEHLFQELTVAGTNDQNLFHISILDKDSIQVRLYEDKNKQKHTLYNQIINTNITKEIRLFGLSKDDEFIVDGEHKTKSKIIIVGGSGDDKVTNNTEQKLIVYDRPKGMTLNGKNIKSKISDKTGVNSYNRKDWKQDRFWHFPLPSFYTDEGLGLSYNIWWKNFGFRSNPYKSDHKLQVSYYFKNNASAISYTSNYPSLISDLDFSVDFKFNGPSFIQYFYGLGNSFVDYNESFPNEANSDDQSFHFVKGTHIDFNPKFIKKIKSNSRLTLNPSFEFFDVKDIDNEPRLYLKPESNIDVESFVPKYYAGLALSFNNSRLDNASLPSRGYRLEILADSRININDSKYKNLNLSTNISAYVPFNLEKTVVLSSYLGYDHLIGNAEFFHYNYLSSKSRLRAFRTNRFAGEQLAYHATDLRVSLIKSKGDLPTVFGLITSFDYGRAWYKEENRESNNKWHTSYGFGIFFAPIDLIGFRISHHRSSKESQFNIGGSLTF